MRSSILRRTALCHLCGVFYPAFAWFYCRAPRPSARFRDFCVKNAQLNSYAYRLFLLRLKESYPEFNGFDNIPKLDWLRKRKEEASKYCDHQKENLQDSTMEAFLTALEEKLNRIKFNSTTEPIYKYRISKTTLDSTFQMFFYLLYCPRSESHDYQSSFFKFLESSSPCTIIEILININKFENTKANKLEMSGESPIGRMVEVLDGALKLDVGKIDLAFLSKHDLYHKEISSLTS